MRYKFSLTRRQLAIALAYSAVFPLTNLAGGALAMFGIIVTLPFLGLAWIGGMVLVSLVGSEQAYLVGASLTVFLQVVSVMFVRSGILRKRDVGAAT